MSTSLKDKLKDIFERAFWTAAEAAVAYASTRVTDIPSAYTPLIATGLAALKGWIAVHVGDKGKASLTPTPPPA